MLLALDLDRDERQGRMRRLLEMIDLPDMVDRALGELSLGMRRRLDILLTLCKPASVYLFDEPYNGLDAAWIGRFAGLVEALRRVGRTVVIASHLTDLLEATADRFWLLEEGRLVRDEPVRPGVLSETNEHRAAVEDLPWLTVG